MDRPVGYDVRVQVQGELAPTWSSVLANLAVVAQPDGTTLVSGVLVDQAEVHGLLAAVRDLGLSLVSVETVAIPRSPSPTGG